MPAEDYAHVKVVDPHLYGPLPEDKLGILDVRVETATSKQIDIEIQLAALPEMPQQSDETPFYLWGRFFRAREEEEFDMLAKQHPAIGAAVVTLKELSQDEALRMLAESRQIAQWTKSPG